MVRRALTMGIDRAAIVKNVFDTLAAPAIGPTVRGLPTTDTTIAQIPYNPTAAMALLDSLGWRDTDHSGVRKKKGRSISVHCDYAQFEQKPPTVCGAIAGATAEDRRADVDPAARSRSVL